MRAKDDIENFLDRLDSGSADVREIESGLWVVRTTAGAGAHPGGADPDGGGLARAVGPEQGEDLALVDVETDVVDGLVAVEVLRQPLDAKEAHSPVLKEV